MLLTDYYAQPSCTAGRSAFLTGQLPVRTGMHSVGLPGGPVGLSADTPTLPEILKSMGYVTGQFGKNHLGDRDEFLPTMHGFDEYWGWLYHLNAMEYTEDPDWPKDGSLDAFAPRNVIYAKSDGKGSQTIEDDGALSIERMHTHDDEVINTRSTSSKGRLKRINRSSLGTVHHVVTFGRTFLKSMKPCLARTGGDCKKWS